MGIKQKTIRLRPYARGFHIISDEIQSVLDSFGYVEAGMLNVFIKHTSASLSINENADPSVLDDMESFFTDVADDKEYYIHTYEVVISNKNNDKIKSPFSGNL